MKLIKYTHSCVRFEDGDARLVIDPGVFSEVATALDGVDAVLITHEHPDHIDTDALGKAAAANPRLAVWAPPGVAASLSELGDRVTAVEPGQHLQVAGFDIATFGGQHALIHPQVPTIVNVAFLINGAVLHPGDSFTVPPVPVKTLLVPLHAPWSKVAEVIDYTISVRAPQVFPIHDSLLTETGRGMVQTMLGRVAGPFGVEYSFLAPGESTSLG